MKRKNWTRMMALSAAALLCASAGAQQASITLGNCDADFCFTHDNTWTLTKAVDQANTVVTDGVGFVTWTVTAVKDSSAAPTFTVHGGLTVTNTGSAPATIGNIVVNLQRANSPKRGSNAPYVSIAANCADATMGDAATSCMILAAASQENAATNAAWAVNNYAVSGQRGTFTESACSGSLEFTDANSNTVWAIVPQQAIAVGASVTLLYSAEFGVACLPPPGTPLRVETLVSFGNAGARGGSGSTGSNIDINGSGTVDPDEAKVRTVPCRDTFPLGAGQPTECNDTVTVSDLGLTTTGTVSVESTSGFEAFPALIGDTSVWSVSAAVDAGAEGGSICNEASLLGEGCGGTLGVAIGYQSCITGYTPPIYDGNGNLIGGNEPIYGQCPVYATFECAQGAVASDGDCHDLTPPEDVRDGDHCSFSQGGFGGSGHPYNLLAANFASMFPSGVEVGIPGAGGFSMTFTSAVAVQNYLPDGGPANKLTADLVNPTTTSSRNMGGQTLALKLNVALSDAGATNAGFGDLYYCNAGDSLSGMTVREILAVAEIALGGGAKPAGYTYSSLAGLCEHLNLSFGGPTTEFPECGALSAWGMTYLSRVTCP